MGLFDTGDAHHPSIRPNGRGAGLVRMDGEQDSSEWTGAATLAGLPPRGCHHVLGCRLDGRCHLGGAATTWGLMCFHDHLHSFVVVYAYSGSFMFIYVHLRLFMFIYV